MSDRTSSSVGIDEVRDALAGKVAIARELSDEAIRLQSIEIASARTTELCRQPADGDGAQFGLDASEVSLDPHTIGFRFTDDPRRGRSRHRDRDPCHQLQHRNFSLAGAAAGRKPRENTGRDFCSASQLPAPPRGFVLGRRRAVAHRGAFGPVALAPRGRC
jgi:hypothetical protein